MARGRKSAAAETPGPEAATATTTTEPSLRGATYRKAHCAAVVAYMGRGFTLMAFAGEIGVSLDTLNAWRQEHAAFDQAAKAGEAAQRRALETNLLAANTGAQVSAHIFALKNAAAEECGDDQAAPPMRAELIVKFV